MKRIRIPTRLWVLVAVGSCIVSTHWAPSAGFGAQDEPEPAVKAVEFKGQQLREGRLVTAVGFEGNVKFRDGTLKGLVDVKAGDPVEGFAIREGRDAIVARYRDAGYSDVLVTYDQQRLAESGELIFQIEEGPRVRITEITFEGNTSLSDRELEKRIDTRTALWIFRSGSFDVDQVESDVVKIESYYRDHGFLDARASFRRELSRDGRSLTIVFEVVEGDPYRIEEIRFRGNAAFKPARDNLVTGQRNHAAGLP